MISFIEVEDNVAEFCLNKPNGYIFSKIKVESKYIDNFDSVSIDDDIQNDIGVGHWVFNLLHDEKAIVTETDLDLDLEIGSVIELNQEEWIELEKELERYNLNKFKEMVGEA